LKAFFGFGSKGGFCVFINLYYKSLKSKKMKRFNFRELLEIISHTETAGDDAKDIAFCEFAEELTGYCRTEKNLAERTRTLRFTRAELMTEQRRFYTEAGKKYAVAGRSRSSHRFNRLRTGHYPNGTGTSRTLCKSG
jgi:hypothetical protein